MSISKVFRESLTVAKENPLIFIPMIVSGLFSALIGLIFVGSAIPMLDGMSVEQITANPQEAMAGAGAAAGGMAVFVIISAFIGLIAHSMSVAMADTAFSGEKAGLKNGWQRIASRLVSIIIASIIMGLMVGLGTVLLVLPGLVLAFFLMFTLIALVVNELRTFQAIKRSFQTVGKNFGATFITFLVILGLGIVTGAANFVVSLIPALGVLLSILVYAVFSAFVTIFLVRVYREMDIKTEGSPEVET